MELKCLESAEKMSHSEWAALIRKVMESIDCDKFSGEPLFC